MRAWIALGSILAGLHVGMACSLFKAPSPAAVAATAECEHYMQVLEQGHKDGLSCPVAKAKAEATEPKCKVTFHCKEETDAGRD